MVDFTSHPATYTAAAKSLSDAAATLEAELATVRTDLAAEGACWGDDDAGSAFSSQYGPAAASALSAIDTLVAAIESVAGGLERMQQNHQRQDQASVTTTLGP